ncbi:Uncharacterized protein BN1224_CV14_A_02770 [Chlamydia pneumoniae]|nr:Uncharacterized protein BN1224_Wien1_A_02750 [Chlamydia pneumoniae]CRI35631.1 Uncharacterized protein BN1224_CM1_A_02780 [Chlamydia pneumoniae]CRI36758.1 Uncharacterized protein BN1224_CV14_A_02770 [Chlamydia pneumoniae]CRI37881.1 Uncharacterized protein BN1224_CV15_B_02040 [Chlamydia pneumoniae]CRI39016.1 Uncharacterized protein BN1224_CWL011_A_02800 [Chlamydia pneumoniae]
MSSALFNTVLRKSSHSDKCPAKARRTKTLASPLIQEMTPIFHSL